MDSLWAMHPEELGVVKIAGKNVTTPRWQQTYGEKGYTFSGLDHKAVPIPSTLQKYLDYANRVCEPYLPPDQVFNMMLLNWYQDGNHYIGYHRDDERQLKQTAQGESFVFSISLGATREFSLKPVDEAKGHASSKLSLRHGDALLMGGRCQKTHKHSILKVSGKKGALLGRRINMTFRVFK